MIFVGIWSPSQLLNSVIGLSSETDSNVSLRELLFEACCSIIHVSKVISDATVTSSSHSNASGTDAAAGGGLLDDLVSGLQFKQIPLTTSPSTVSGSRLPLKR